MRSPEAEVEAKSFIIYRNNDSNTIKFAESNSLTVHVPLCEET